jgi:hypothetical protein
VVLPHPWCENTVSHHGVKESFSYTKFDLMVSEFFEKRDYEYNGVVVNLLFMIFWLMRLF